MAIPLRLGNHLDHMCGGPAILGSIYINGKSELICTCSKCREQSRVFIVINDGVSIVGEDRESCKQKE